MGFLTSVLRKSQENIDGIVTMRLFNGNATPCQRSSNASSYDRQLETMQINDSIDVTDVEGFIRVQALRLRAHAAINTKHTPRAPSRWPSARLVLEDGIVDHARAFGCPISVAGEAVFRTGMVGLPETLTDPSYAGQILTLTYPLIGNHGVPNANMDHFGVTKYFESHGAKIHITGLVVWEYCEEASHWQKKQTLHEWLKSQNISAIMMIDTRDLVKRVRESGTAIGKILVNYDVPFVNPNEQHLVNEVSTREPR